MNCLTKIFTCYPSLFHSGTKSKSAQMFSDIGILKTFAKFTRKQLRWSLLIMMLYDKYKRERQHLKGGHKIIKKIDLNEQCKYKM